MNLLKNHIGTDIAHHMRFHPELEELARKIDRASKAHFAAAHLPWDGTMEGHKRRQGIIDSTRETERLASREFEAALKRAGFKDSFELLRRISRLLDSADLRRQKMQKIRNLIE